MFCQAGGGKSFLTCFFPVPRMWKDYNTAKKSARGPMQYSRGTKLVIAMYLFFLTGQLFGGLPDFDQDALETPIQLRTTRDMRSCDQMQVDILPVEILASSKPLALKGTIVRG